MKINSEMRLTIINYRVIVFGFLSCLHISKKVGEITVLATNYSSLLKNLVNLLFYDYISACI